MKSPTRGKKFFIQYAAYLFRWQLSTPILAPCILWLGWLPGKALTATIIANFIGGLIFFWVDRFIFTSKHMNPIWDVRANITCVDCGREVSRGYRLVSDPTLGYDRSKDEHPQYRCEQCSMAKYEQTKLRSVL